MLGTILRERMFCLSILLSVNWVIEPNFFSASSTIYISVLFFFLGLVEAVMPPKRKGWDTDILLLRLRLRCSGVPLWTLSSWLLVWRLIALIFWSRPSRDLRCPFASPSCLFSFFSFSAVCPSAFVLDGCTIILAFFDVCFFLIFRGSSSYFGSSSFVPSKKFLW